MEDLMVTNGLLSAMAHLYERLFLLENNAIVGHVFQEGDWKKVDCFVKWCEERFHPCYDGDDFAIFQQKIAPENILGILKTEDEYSVEFSVIEEETVHRKSMRMFLCDVDDLICVCVEDITKQYDRERRRERIASGSLALAQQAILVTEQIQTDLKEEICLPPTQVADLLELALQSGDGELRLHVEEAIKILENHTHEVQKLLSVSVMKRGEEFEQQDVILVSDFAEELAETVRLYTAEPGCEVEIGEKAEKIGGFISNHKILLQMLGNVWAGIAVESDNISVRAKIDFERSNDNVELLFAIAAKDDKREFSYNPQIIFAQHLAQHMSGTICFKREANEIKMLVVRLPVERATKEQQRKKKVIGRVLERVGPEDFSAFRALVADDNEISRDITVSKLRQFGLEVEVARDGQEAKNMLLASPGRYYHILFTKMHLLKMDGTELTMELRQHKRRDLNDMTIVAVTTNPMRDKRLVALEHGMDYHMILPFNDIELKEMLLRELEDIGPEEAHEKFGFRIIK